MTKLVDAIVIFVLCAAVAFGFFGIEGCTARTFNVAGDPLEETDAEDANMSSDETIEVSVADTRQEEILAIDTATASDAIMETHEASDTTPTFAHRTATGEDYTSSLPASVYSPALFDESLDQIRKAHPGLWYGPYEAICNLSSEGHGTAEKCQTIQKSDMGVLLCPYGISYVRSDGPSCPPTGAKVSWW